MLTAEGCRQRRQRLLERMPMPADFDQLVLGDPIHLRYFANYYVDPISLSGDSGGLLVIDRDGRSNLFCDNLIPSDSFDSAHVDERIRVRWYDGQSPAVIPRQLVLAEQLAQITGSRRIHDQATDLLGPAIIRTVADMRRIKDRDEIDLLRCCMAAGKVGHDWARSNTQAGMSELDVYAGVCAAVNRHVGRYVVVYGDFAVSPGPERIGGPPTNRVLSAGDLLIVDFSVVLGGYRSDFTNTLVIGGKPTAEQNRLFDLCYQAMRAGETKLKAGATCQSVYDAVHGAFEKAGVADHFPHHAGHGLGLQHPEAPYFVRQSTETLLAGDVVTLEPGLYVPGVGGMRIEHNYLIAESGFERLSNHEIALE